MAYVSFRQRIQHVDIRNEKLVEIEFWRPDRLGSFQLCLASDYLRLETRRTKANLQKNGEEVRKRTEQDEEKNA